MSVVPGEELFEAARAVSDRLDAIAVEYCVIGGVALQRWGRPRATVDVDFVAYAGFGEREHDVTEAILGHFAPRRPDARAFAQEHRVLVARTDSGVGIDVSLGALPFERALIERATEFAYTNMISLRTCSAEDLVVLKAFADRPRDWSDIEGVAIRQRDALDWDAIESRLRPLAELKEAPEILDRLSALRAVHGPGPRD